MIYYDDCTIPSLPEEVLLIAVPLAIAGVNQLISGDDRDRISLHNSLTSLPQQSQCSFSATSLNCGPHSEKFQLWYYRPVLVGFQGITNDGAVWEQF